MTTMSLIETLARDVRYAVRMLRKAPAFTIASAPTLALGIGANTAVVTVVDALLFTPLPYPQPDWLGMLDTTHATRRSATTATPARTAACGSRSGTTLRR